MNLGEDAELPTAGSNPESPFKSSGFKPALSSSATSSINLICSLYLFFK